MKSKISQNEQLAAAIWDYCAMYEVHLPDDKKQFKQQRKEVLRVAEYGEQLGDLLGELIRLYYALRQTFGTFAEFGDGDGERARMVPLTFFYSRHRLDYAWNMRKSQLVRGRYFQYLQTATDDHGRLLMRHYLPIHLTLTVPHAGGLFRGQRFYARELIKSYAELRKSDVWKEYVYAGEYGLEVKRGRSGNGLHIHVHSLLLQYPEFSRNQAAEAIEAEWRRIMSNSSPFSGIHYETLYCRKALVEGGAKVKVHLDPAKCSLDDYLAGVMECIKYHFKPDCLLKVGEGFDLELIQDILQNTRGLRMYSRFGAFYKQPALNFGKLHDAKPIDELTTEEVEEEVRASSDGVEERLVDPRTMRPAVPESYRIKVGHPLNLKYYGGDSLIPREAYEYTQAKSRMLTAPAGLTLKEVIGLQVSGHLERLCAWAENHPLTPAQAREYVQEMEQQRKERKAPAAPKPLAKGRKPRRGAPPPPN